MTNERVKRLFFRASSLLAVFTLLLTSTFVGAARQARTTPPARQEEGPPGPRPRAAGPEVFRVELPKECERIRPDVQTHDASDGFSPPGNPVTLSPALAAYAAGKLTRGYDDEATDRWFFDSFKLKGCRVCYATLELGLSHQPETPIEHNGTGHQSGKTVLTSFYNDNLYVGSAPFTPASTILFTSLWPPLNTNPPTGNPKTMPLVLPAGALNNYLMSGTAPPSHLDILIQDDTAVDYATLTVWYY